MDVWFFPILPIYFFIPSFFVLSVINYADQKRNKSWQVKFLANNRQKMHENVIPIYKWPKKPPKGPQRELSQQSGQKWHRYVMPVYICVFVVLSWVYSRRESEKLDITLDSTVFVGRKGENTYTFNRYIFMIFYWVFIKQGAI